MKYPKHRFIDGQNRQVYIAAGYGDIGLPLDFNCEFDQRYVGVTLQTAWIQELFGAVKRATGGEFKGWIL